MGASQEPGLVSTRMGTVGKALSEPHPAAILPPNPPRPTVLSAVSHQPTWSEAVAVVIGGVTSASQPGLVRIDLRVDRWEEAGPATGVLAWKVGPRLFPRAS